MSGSCGAFCAFCGKCGRKIPDFMRSNKPENVPPPGMAAEPEPKSDPVAQSTSDRKGRSNGADA